MKKNMQIYAAAAAIMLACTACAGQSETPGTEPPSEAGSPEQSVSQANDTQSPTDTGTNPEENVETQETSAESTSVQDMEDTAQSVNITIEFQTEKNDAAQEGTEIYTSSCIYPIVTIEGNEAAAEKINADIQNRVASFRDDTSVLDEAKEIYGLYLTDNDDDYPFQSYENDLWFTVTRSDSNVISFVEDYYFFSGGAHGLGTKSGINYNTKTGELISFAALSDNPDQFHADTLAYNQMLAETDAYKGQMFDGESGLSSDLESVLYADDKWFLSTSGLTFISDPYALGPYSSGTIEFTIPYSKLETMGLKEEYSYSGNLTIPLTDGEACSIDLNGDGNEDTIEYMTEQAEQADGTYASLVHLVINGTDFAQEGNEELQKQLSSLEWADCILYDMNPSDKTIEIVFMTQQFNEGEAAVSYSTFYRYEEDGTLTYVGMTRGSVTDPAFVF